MIKKNHLAPQCEIDDKLTWPPAVWIRCLTARFPLRHPTSPGRARTKYNLASPPRNLAFWATGRGFGLALKPHTAFFCRSFTIVDPVLVIYATPPLLLRSSATMEMKRCACPCYPSDV